MSLWSWITGKHSVDRTPPVDRTAEGLCEIILDWCSSTQFAETRTLLRIPENARDFETELFYLYFFLMMLGIELSYRDKKAFSMELATSLIHRVNELIAASDALPFPVSSDILVQRYKEYGELREHGLEALLENLPFRFLILNGVLQSDMREDIDVAAPVLLSMEVWTGTMLKHILAANDEWRRITGF